MGDIFKQCSFHFVPFQIPHVISTKGAFRRPMTYHNHPVPSHPIHPIIHPQSIFNNQNRPRIDLRRPSMT